jgi:hypothetical protein
MRFPIKSATILMLMSFAGGIYIALHDDGWSQQLDTGSSNICATELAQRVPGGSTQADHRTPGAGQHNTAQCCPGSAVLPSLSL